jgi:hypothetical protein
VQVFEATEQAQAQVKRYLDRCSGYVNQRKREDMRTNKILAERELRPIKNYKPNFRCFPIDLKEFSVKLSSAELKQLRQLHGRKDLKDEDVVRASFMLWFQQNRMKPHWIHPDGPGCC